jgi:hypothetical protein
MNNHPFTDTLWSVYRDGNKFLVAGKEGVLYSQNNGGTISEVNSFASLADSLIYAQSNFYDCFVDGNDLWFCGADTVSNKGVIFHSDGTYGWTCTHQSTYTDKFMAIKRASSRIYFVGGNGYAQYQVSGWALEHSGNIHPWSNYEYTSSAQMSYGIVTLSGEYVTHIVENQGPQSHYWTPSNYQAISIKSLTTQSYYAIRDNSIFYSQMPFNNWDHMNAISDVDSFNCILSTNGVLLGSTDGVYRYNENWGYGEKIVGSEGYSIFGVHAQSGPSFPVYAVGADGKIIRTTNILGPTFPYVGFDFEGGYCLDSTYTIENLGNDTYTYEWFLDNVSMGNTYDLTHTFTTSGFHILKLVGSNGTHSDSLIKGFFVTDPPAPTLTHSVSQTIICHEGFVDFTFQTESGIQYALMRDGLNTPDTVFVGNGGSLTVSSDLITDTTIFELYAGYPSQNCYVRHDLDTINVQHPEAEFYINLINAEQGEAVWFVDQSLNSDTLEWLNTPYSPVHLVDKCYQVDFSTTGYHEIGIVAKTNFGCADTLYKSQAIFIVDTLEYTDVCFDLLFVEDFNYSPHFKDLEVERDSVGNFYIASKSNMNIPSTIGKEIPVISPGCFLAKYNKYGVLKWVFQGSTNTPSTWNTYGDGSINVEIWEDGRIIFDVYNILDMDLPILHSTDGKVYDLTNNPYSSSLGNQKKMTMILTNDGIFKKMTVVGHPETSPLGIDSLENFYVSLDKYYTTIPKYIYYDPDTTFLFVPSDNVFTKYNETGTVWELPQDYKPWFNFGHQLSLGKEVIYIYGHEFGLGSSQDSLYSTDGSVHGPNSSHIFMAAYDTAGQYDWHYGLGNLDNNSSLVSLVDENSNVYLTFGSVNSGTTVTLIDTTQTSTIYNSRLLSLDRDGHVRFDYGFIGLTNFGYNLYEMEESHGSILMSFKATSFTNDTIFIEDSPTTVLTLPIDITLDYFFYLEYDTNGILLNYKYESGVVPFLYGAYIFPETAAIDNASDIVYGSTIDWGATWNNTYYPPIVDPVSGSLEKGRTIVVNSLNSNCELGALTLQPFDTVCYVDSVGINLSSSFTPYNQFLANNNFIVHTSTTPIFNDTLLGDTILGSTSLSNLYWQFDFSSSQPDTLWVRIETTHPSLTSNSVPLVFPPTQLGSFETIYRCSNAPVDLTATDGVIYEWLDENNVVVGNSDLLAVNLMDSIVNYTVSVSNACGFVWVNSYELIPSLYSGVNADSILLCENVQESVVFEPQYTYSITGFSSQVANNSYFFEFNTDTTITYSLADSLGCDYVDSIYFDVTIPSIPVITQVGLPWELDVNSGYTFYQWSSPNLFTFGTFGPNSILPLEDGVFTIHVIDSNGCITSASYTFLTINLDELTNGEFIIYPNPAHESITIISPNCSSYAIEIYDLLGVRVGSGNFVGCEYEIPVNTFTNGIYMLHLSNNIDTQIFRIVKN